jgi:hypothetical protein
MKIEKFTEFLPEHYNISLLLSIYELAHIINDNLLVIWNIHFLYLLLKKNLKDIWIYTYST